MMDAFVVVLTGANDGIGLGLTVGLLEKGYRVAGIDIRTDRLEELTEAHPGDLIVFPCDVTNDLAVRAATVEVIDRFGRIDILVNNAAVAVFESIHEREIDDIRREFDVNYFGYLRMIRAVLPHMMERRRGIIHNVSSGVGLTGFPGLAGYSSTKGAIESLSRTLALELRPHGIHVTTMHPPLTNTKSASPLGIPAEAMADPMKIGRQLAGRIRATKPVVTSGIGASLGLSLNRLFPTTMGRFLTRMTERARPKPA